MNLSRNAAKLLRAFRPLPVALVLVLTFAAPASASVASEQQQGAQILSAVHAGQLKGTSLSSSQYEQLGEYLMAQALGSTAAHERMNALADQMMGSAAVDQMHVYLGERYLGKSTAQVSGRYAPMYGLIGMMTGYRGSSSIAGMMSGYLNSQSQSAAPYTAGHGMMGYGTQSSGNSNGGWPTGAILATAILVALLLGGLATILVRRRGPGHGGNPATSATR